MMQHSRGLFAGPASVLLILLAHGLWHSELVAASNASEQYAKSQKAFDSSLSKVVPDERTRKLIGQYLDVIPINSQVRKAATKVIGKKAVGYSSGKAWIKDADNNLVRAPDPIMRNVVNRFLLWKPFCKPNKYCMPCTRLDCKLICDKRNGPCKKTRCPVCPKRGPCKDPESTCSPKPTCKPCPASIPSVRPLPIPPITTTEMPATTRYPPTIQSISTGEPQSKDPITTTTTTTTTTTNIPNTTTIKSEQMRVFRKGDAMLLLLGQDSELYKRVMDIIKSIPEQSSGRENDKVMEVFDNLGKSTEYSGKKANQSYMSATSRSNFFGFADTLLARIFMKRCECPACFVRPCNCSPPPICPIQEICAPCRYECPKTKCKQWPKCPTCDIINDLKRSTAKPGVIQSITTTTSRPKTTTTRQTTTSTTLNAIQSITTTTSRPTTTSTSTTSTKPNPINSISTTSSRPKTTSTKRNVIQSITTSEPATTTKPTTAPSSRTPATMNSTISPESDRNLMLNGEYFYDSVDYDDDEKANRINETELTREFKCIVGEKKGPRPDQDLVPFGSICSFKDTCGQAPLNRLTPKTRSVGYMVGGKAQQYGEWPSWVRVQIEHSVGSGMCGGVLISDRHVLSAGHCFSTSENNKTVSAKRTKVILGEHKWESEDKFERSVLVSQVCRANKFYNPDGARYDYTVLTLKEPVKFNDHINIACLPWEQISLNTTKCFVVGLGLTRTKDSQVDFPDRVQMMKVKPASCNTWQLSNKDMSRHCFTRADGLGDTCAGDSGSPVLCLNKKKRWTVVGLVSYGSDTCDGTGDQGWVGVYTRVHSLLDMIQSDCYL